MLAMAFGVSSLVLSIVAIFVPVFGVFVAGLSGILACVSVGRAVFLGFAAVIINTINIFFLSPTFMLLVALDASQRTPEQSKILAFWIIVLVIQVTAVFLYVFNSVLFSFLTYYFNLKKTNQTTSADREHKGSQDINSPFDNHLRDTYEGSTRLSTAPRLTRIIVRKTHGGRKESKKFWESSSTASPISENVARVKNNRKERVGLPVLAVSLVCIVALAGWAGFNYYYKSFESVPLSRVYESKAGTRNPQKFTEANAGSASKIKSKNIPKTKSEISKIQEPNGVLYTWKDKGGVTNFSNVAPPQEVVSVRTEAENNPYNNRTKVEIHGNKIYVPVTIAHSRKKIDTSLLLDTGCTTTVLPERITRYLNATHIGSSRSRVADGRFVRGEKKVVENFIVGPYVHKTFEVISQAVAGSQNKGLLGMDFLKHHPFTIDYQNQFIVWQ